MIPGRAVPSCVDVETDRVNCGVECASDLSRIDGACATPRLTVIQGRMGTSFGATLALRGVQRNLGTLSPGAKIIRE